MGLFRFSLALCVLFAHFPDVSLLRMHFGDGFLAVQCFYMISGFYMAFILNEKYTGPGSYRLFIEQRYLRLYPAYLVLFLFTMAVEFAMRKMGSSPNWGLDYWLKYSGGFAPSTWLAMGASNLSAIGLDITDFFTALDPQTGRLYWTSTLHVPVPGYYFSILPPAWTISVEICFYLAAPFLVRKSVVFQSLIVLLSFGLRGFFAHYLDLSQESWSYRFFFFEIGLFLLGSLAYRACRAYGPFLQRQARFFPWLRWIFFFLWAFYTRLPFSPDTHYYLFAVGTFLLLPYLFLMTKDLPFDRLLGELSYPMYLAHWSVILLITPWILRLPHSLGGVVYVGLVVALSWVVYRFIELPMHHIRHRLFLRQKKRIEDGKALAPTQHQEPPGNAVLANDERPL